MNARRRCHARFIMILTLVAYAASPTLAAEQPVENRGAIAATVNGTPIFARDVEAGIPEDAFGQMYEQLKQQKTEHLIMALALRQFFTAQGITVTDAEIDARVAQLRKTPPAAGCSCCRYESLEQFMEMNGLSMPGLRRVLWNDLAFDKHVDVLWLKDYPTDTARKAAARVAREQLTKQYIKASHIFFNVFQAADYEANPGKEWKRAIDAAAVAHKRLASGEEFAVVARDVSEDSNSAPAGGSLGCMPRLSFGPQFAEVIEGLAVGEVSEPFLSSWGCHIARRDAMAEDDLITIIKQQFIQDVDERTYAAAVEGAAIERFDDAVEP